MPSVDRPRVEELLTELNDLVGCLVDALQSRSAALTDAEIEALTGYLQPAAQLRDLQARGFHRAHRNLTGRVILERPHFEAVSRGSAATPSMAEPPHVHQGPRWRVARD
jgi:hypothetical protein